MRWIFLLGNTYNKTVTWYNVSNDFHIYKRYKYGLSSLFLLWRWNSKKGGKILKLLLK